ncbi:hypothetical protein K5V21_00135 [Clostridium sardiniense]|uniref:DoxX-like family protein n=1 Tax=Clostridium sardiniense TaxID=29369 RepID=A0ABS7KSR9_CLOSR|nr:hypothetical protein [Clostridium sardiniense]MBY0753850.1 hypothetical protein [Clostridium sardiniense]MDQ0459636.1 hypothetical protein [Clostridium sardiniense]
MVENNKSIVIKLIGYFYIFGAIILVLTFGVKQEINFNIRFGMQYIPEGIFKVALILVTAIMAYGYLKMKIWGYWMMVIYSILFLFASLNGISNYNSQPFIGNTIFSIIVLACTFKQRKSFT